jgi:hypothetical protein
MNNNDARRFQYACHDPNMYMPWHLMESCITAAAAEYTELFPWIVSSFKHITIAPISHGTDNKLRDSVPSHLVLICAHSPCSPQIFLVLLSL